MDLVDWEPIYRLLNLDWSPIWLCICGDVIMRWWRHDISLGVTHLSLTEQSVIRPLDVRFPAKKEWPLTKEILRPLSIQKYNTSYLRCAKSLSLVYWYEGRVIEKWLSGEQILKVNPTQKSEWQLVIPDRVSILELLTDPAWSQNYTCHNKGVTTTLLLWFFYPTLRIPGHAHLPANSPCSLQSVLASLTMSILSLLLWLTIISNNSSFHQKHRGVPDGSDGFDGTSYRLTE